MSALQMCSDTLIFWPICISSLYSTSISKFDDVMHQAIPPMTLSKAFKLEILILK